MRFFTRKVLHSPDMPDDPYLTRWTLFSCRWFQIMLHKFHRSDNAAVHDHPWSFVSLVLWRGYFEWLERRRVTDDEPAYPLWGIRLLRRWPLSLAFRRAEDRHRVALLGAFPTRELLVPTHTLPAWTLVVTGPRRREWFFYPQGVRVPWRVLVELGEAEVDRRIDDGCDADYFAAYDLELRALEALRAASLADVARAV